MSKLFEPVANQNTNIAAEVSKVARKRTSGLTVKTILRHGNCFLSSVATDCKDGNELKLENIAPIFSSFEALSSKITKIIIMASSP